MRKWVITYLLFLFAGTAYSQSFENYINDYASIFSSRAERFVTDSLVLFEKKTSNQIVFVTMKTIPDEQDIFTYSMKLADSLGIGQARLDNGVLVMIVTEGQREFRIYPGRGLEGAMPDVLINRFFRKVARPLLQAGDYDSVLLQTAWFIMDASRGEFTNNEVSETRPEGKSIFPLLIVLGLMYLVLSRLAKRGKYIRTAGGRFKAKGKQDHSAIPYILPFILGSVFRNGGGGFGDSGGFGGGGFGGFSGGGGSFGGGGGGGSW